MDSTIYLLSDYKDSTTAVPDVPVATSTSLTTLLNMIGFLIGLGQFSTAYALQNGVWASAFLLCGLFLLGAYTSHLLGLCLATNSFMALFSFTISMTDHLTRVLDGYRHFHVLFFSLSTAQSLTVIAIIVSIPTVWLKNLNSISFISTFSILLSLSICIALICTCFFGGVKANKDIQVFRIKNIFSVSGLYIFNIASHMAIPDVYRSMGDPTTFSTVYNYIWFLIGESYLLHISFLSFGAVSALYTVLAFLKAKMFGPEVSSQVTLSMPKHLVCTQITPMTKYVSFRVPMASEVERHLPAKMPSWKRTVIRGAAGSLFLLIFLVLAITIPMFKTVLGLTGSLVSIFVFVILPIAFYLRIFRKTIPLASLVIHLIIIVICLSI
ncbi:hypothetical protein MKX01_030836 [Papaver californicum]|nr:hypothetical protein MKX01_030836 [Papaver californicum]